MVTRLSYTLIIPSLGAICDEDTLNNKFDYLKTTGDSVLVTFMGDSKLRCGEPFIAPQIITMT